MEEAVILPHSALLGGGYNGVERRCDVAARVRVFAAMETRERREFDLWFLLGGLGSRAT